MDANGLHLSPDGGTEDVFRGELNGFRYYRTREASLLLTQGSVYPGDRVQTIYTLDTSTGNWNDDWSVTRGQAGTAAKQGPFSGNLVLNPKIASQLFLTFKNEQSRS